MICWSVFGSQNLPLPSRIYPLFNKCICKTLPESTPPSRNIPTFSTTIILCDPPRNYPSLPEYTPLFKKCLCATLPESTPPSQNIPPFHQLCATLLESNPSSQNIPPFQQIYMCDPPRIYPSLPEYTPFFNNCMRPFQNLLATPPPPSQNIPPFNNYVQPSQNLILPTRIYPPFQQIYIVWPSQNLPLPPWIYSPFNNYMRPSQNLPLPPSLPPRIYTPIFNNNFIMRRYPKSIPPSQNTPPFQQLYATLPETYEDPEGTWEEKK